MVCEPLAAPRCWGIPPAEALLPQPPPIWPTLCSGLLSHVPEVPEKPSSASSCKSPPTGDSGGVKGPLCRWWALCGDDRLPGSLSTCLHR